MWIFIYFIFTGIAATQYSGGMIVHRWSGLFDGRYETTTLVRLVSTLDLCRERVRGIDVLIIDEISMISRHVFDQVEAVCRGLRNSSLLFGRVQLIVAGDFFQLQPVPSPFIPGKIIFGDFVQ